MRRVPCFAPWVRKWVAEHHGRLRAAAYPPIRTSRRAALLPAREWTFSRVVHMASTRHNTPPYRTNQEECQNPGGWTGSRQEMPPSASKERGGIAVESGISDRLEQQQGDGDGDRRVRLPEAEGLVEDEPQQHADGHSHAGQRLPGIRRQAAA